MQTQAIGQYQSDSLYLFLKENLTYKTNFKEIKSLKGNWVFLTDEDGDYIKLVSKTNTDHFFNFRDSLLIFRNRQYKKFTFIKQ